MCLTGAAPIKGFVPPSIPLIVMDPYMNIWSTDTNLYDDWPKYWNSKVKAFSGFIRIDGSSYRFMGPNNDQVDIDAVVQTSVTVWPTRTIYEFNDPQQRVHLTVQFTSPLLPQRWDILSRPTTYITLTVKSLDGVKHSVQLYYDNTAEVAVNNTSQEVTGRKFQVSNSDFDATVLEIGTKSQIPFDITFDGDCIDWGYAYVSVKKDSSESAVIANSITARTTFISTGELPSSDDTNFPRPADQKWPVMAVAWDIPLDEVSEVSKFITFAYDDVYSIKFFNHNFQPYWRRPSGFNNISELLSAAIVDYRSLMSDCETFDLQTYQQLRDKGGDEYATLTAITYRQTVASTKLVWNDKLNVPYVFLKDISSGGAVSTVHIVLKASPLLLYHDPQYLIHLLLPIFAYCNNETGNSQFNYNRHWAPVNLGTYPMPAIKLTQQGIMPMEQSGNMLIMLAAATQQLGVRSTVAWYPKYWHLLQDWVNNIVSKLPNPGNQASHDDVMAPTRQNANLAIKGIVALGAFSEICRILGRMTEQDYFLNLAKSFAVQWVKLAVEGNHYKLYYDLNNTWSLKYNLMFEKVLGLSIFPEDVISTEMAYYLKYRLNTYGIPMDNRGVYTRIDVVSWVAAMTADVDQQRKIFSVLYNWAKNTQPSTPLTDWYDTVSGKQFKFTARAAVGGLYGLMVV